MAKPLLSRSYSVEVQGTDDRADRRATAIQAAELSVVTVMAHRLGRASRRWTAVRSLFRDFDTWPEAVAYCDELVTTDAPETLALYGAWREPS